MWNKIWEIMAFYKKKFQKISGLWYPQSVTVGETVNTDAIADRLAQISTVSRTDVKAVLEELAGVLADYMKLGRTVKLDGLGTFYYTAVATKQGVPTPEEVSAKQIIGTRVRFIPETTRSDHNRTATRTLAPSGIKWEEIKLEAEEKKTADTDGTDSPDTGGDGGATGGNPL